MPALLALVLSTVTPYRPGPSPTPYIALMIVGFVVGVAGHLVRSRILIALGVLMIFAATVLLPLEYAGEFQ